MSLKQEQPEPSADNVEGNINWRPITKPELAKYMRVGERTIDYWIAARKIPYFKIGRLVRFSLPAVEKALSRYEVKEVSLS